MCNRLRLLSQNSFKTVELPMRVENRRCSRGLIIPLTGGINKIENDKIAWDCIEIAILSIYHVQISFRNICVFQTSQRVVFQCSIWCNKWFLYFVCKPIYFQFLSIVLLRQLIKIGLNDRNVALVMLRCFHKIIHPLSYRKFGRLFWEILYCLFLIPLQECDYNCNCFGGACFLGKLTPRKLFCLLLK